jgi:prepilin-type N-terminal cleavage/methylation domain-containing protein
MMRRSRPRSGFTLIEMLVVITVIGILLTFTAGAAFKYMASAKVRATEATITTLDNAVTQRLESFVYKVKPPVLTRHLVLAGQGGVQESQTLIQKRAAIIAMLEAMRGDFPQQFADFLPASVVATGTYTGTGLATNLDTTYADNAVAASSRTRAAIEQEYRRLTFEKNPTLVPNNGDPTKPTQIAPHDHLTESSASLYLMLKVGSGEGSTFDISQIPPAFIKDTDGDGVPEFVDSWGTPLRFYRWPTDYLSAMMVDNRLASTAPQARNSLDPDSLFIRNLWTKDPSSTAFEQKWTNGGTTNPVVGCFFRVHDYDLVNDPTGNTLTTNPIALPTYPLIVSAGPDATGYSKEDRWQAFGLWWDDKGTGANVPTAPISYSWPPPNFLQARGGYVLTLTTQAGAGASGDNIVSRILRAGQESQ